MAKNTPAFQFYPSDFLGGVVLLDEEQVGVYIKLLCCLWIQGNSVPSGFPKLARAASIPEDVLQRVWPSIQDKFVIENGNVTHARFTKMMEITERNRLNGVCGGRPAKTQNKTQSISQSKTQKETQSKPNSLKIEERRLKTEDRSLEAEDWNLPDGWDLPEVRKALDDWADMRIRKKVPIRSRKSTSKIFKQFESPEQLIKVCEICEANEWQGLDPEYSKSNKPSGSSRLTPAQQREANMLEVRRKIEAEQKAEQKTGQQQRIENGKT